MTRKPSVHQLFDHRVFSIAYVTMKLIDGIFVPIAITFFAQDIGWLATFPQNYLQVPTKQ